MLLTGGFLCVLHLVGAKKDECTDLNPLVGEQELLAAYEPGGVLALNTKNAYDLAALPNKDVFIFISVPSADGAQTGSMLESKIEAFAAALTKSEQALVASLDVMADGLNDDMTPGHSCRLKWFMDWSGRCPAALFPVCPIDYCP